MHDKKLQLELFHAICRKKNLLLEQLQKINGVEGSVPVNERVAQNYFRRFKEDDNSIEDKPKSGRPVVEYESLFK